MTISTPAGSDGSSSSQPLLDPLDHVQGVLAVAHDHDAADGVARPVEVGHAAADLGAQTRPAPRPAAAPARRPSPAFTTICSKSSRLFDVAAAAHHVLRAAPLDEPAADLVVGVPDGLDHGGERQVVGGEPVRVHGDLVLLDVAADRGHLGHAGHRLQRVAQGPVLVGAQLVERVPARAGRPARTGRPSPRRSRRARARCARPRAGGPGSWTGTRAPGERAQ